MNDNLYCALSAGFADNPDAVAIETLDGADAPLRYSWRDLERASAMLANLLESLALPAGSRVLAQVDKSVEALLLYLATLRAGHVFVPLNPAYREAELAHFVTDAEPAVVVCAPRDFGWLSKLAFSHGARAVYTLDAARGGSLLARAAHCSDQHRPAPRRPDDLAAIIYTSGTTGRSKGAMLSHGNLLANARVLQDYWGWRADDVLLHTLPIFHVHGLFVAAHGALLNGSPMLWLGRFDAAAAVQALPRATLFMGVPTMYTRMLGEPTLTADACSRMRLFISGSAPLLAETFSQWRERTGHVILERYGMSETVMLTSNPWLPDLRHGGAHERRAGTVGFALPGVDLRICDERDQPVPAGETGGIQVRGPSVFAGYWRLPEKTAQEFTADGWFRTGDVGRIDTDGYLHIVGRAKDLLISGGYNVYPAEVEGFINALPGVAESAVVGVPHPDLGEAGVAVVVARPGHTLDPAQLLEQLRPRLAAFKLPRHWAVLPELPRNAMGKVQKNLLREQFGSVFSA